jgi:hypothetical protein
LGRRVLVNGNEICHRIFIDDCENPKIPSNLSSNLQIEKVEEVKKEKQDSQSTD